MVGVLRRPRAKYARLRPLRAIPFAVRFESGTDEDIASLSLHHRWHRGTA
jgi:hypothetical protein